MDEVVKSDGQEEERPVIDVPLAPVLTGNHESGVQTSSVGDIQPISSSSEPGSSSTDTDDTSDDEAAGGHQDAGRHTEARSSKVTCRVCGKLFRQLGILLSHVWDHGDEPQSICGVCGERLESAETLKEHVTRHTKGFSLGHLGKDPLSGVAKRRAGDRFKCNTCSRAFSTTAALRSHSWVHQDRAPVRCHFCLKSFALKADFLAHRKLHASCRGHSCRLCEKAYLSKAMLKEHEKTHDHQRRTLGADASSRACCLCNVSFESNEALKTHMSGHFGDALFKCHECGSCFSQGVDFNRHVMTHSAVRPCGSVSDGKEVQVRTRDGEAPQEEPHCSWSE
ncbi:zinc finger protein 596-like [Fundulus heteroclitus]|uniref:zinc finger protein 596-like n=1 Tax=Fundulus heteroclitus TaxID=8078 RepID=UPI00165CBE98|nr:zinc finger protein 596-like [Fundulus heteroclitus]